MVTFHTHLIRMTSCSCQLEATLWSNCLATKARRPGTRLPPVVIRAISKTRIIRALTHLSRSSIPTVSMTSAVALYLWHINQMPMTSSRRTSSYSACSTHACGTFTRISRSRRICPRARMANAFAHGTGYTSQTLAPSRVGRRLSKFAKEPGRLINL